MVATLLKLTFGFLLVVIGANAINASAASVATPNSAASLEVQVVTADDMKPASCAGIVLTAVVAGSGTVTGTSCQRTHHR
jgi:hypothetical protein